MKHSAEVKRPASKTGTHLLALLALFTLVMLLLGFLLIVGCGEELHVDYGQRKGTHWDSVNGTGVLSEMLEEAGHKVFSWWILSPRLQQRADCMVWFPNDFSPPSEEVCLWLEDWLKQKPDRTLIYVGRDFDAAVWYWNKIEPDAPQERKSEIRRRRLESKADFLSGLNTAPADESCRWFTISGKYKPRRVTSLEGDPRWTQGIDPLKLDIELNHRMTPSDGAETLLESEGDVLISSRRFARSRLILVANGSSLLNLPLVNQEHRKLAGQLVEELGDSPQTVVFLESQGDLPISDSDTMAGPPTGMEIFNIWPTNWILLHLSILGILFCFSRYAIFGRPLEPEQENISDFGEHTRSLGQLLERSGDSSYAMTKLLHYQQITRADSGGPRS